MELTSRRLNRATLARQLLLERTELPAAEGIRQIVALQAQEPASPFVALWNRLDPFDPDDLVRAFTDGTVVKAGLMRITLHAVHRDDYPRFYTAMLPNLRASRVHDRRYTTAGLTPADADRAVEDLMAFAAVPRTKGEIETALEGRAGRTGDAAMLWWALRTFAPLLRAPTGGPWAFDTTVRYVAAGRIERPEGPAGALPHLIRRYLEGFGPASAADFAQFALQRQAEIRPALDEMTGSLVTHEGPGGTVLYDVPEAPLPPEDTPAPPRLLGMWESILLAYRDRGRVIPEQYRSTVIRRNGDVLPTLLVDGYVAGVWRPHEGGIEVAPFASLPDETWAQVAAEARGMAALLSRAPGTYEGRYLNWWQDLPEAGRRLLPS